MTEAMLLARLKTGSERSFTDAVLKLARLRGWRCHHGRPAMLSSGAWRTAIQGDAGFPDLVLVRKGRCIIAELKVGNGKPTTAQESWLVAFKDVPGIEARLWYPTNWDEIETMLK